MLQPAEQKRELGSFLSWAKLAPRNQATVSQARSMHLHRVWLLGSFQPGHMKKEAVRSCFDLFWFISTYFLLHNTIYSNRLYTIYAVSRTTPRWLVACISGSTCMLTACFNRHVPTQLARTCGARLSGNARFSLLSRAMPREAFCNWPVRSYPRSRQPIVPRLQPTGLASPYSCNQSDPWSPLPYQGWKPCLKSSISHGKLLISYNEESTCLLLW